MRPGDVILTTSVVLRDTVTKPSMKVTMKSRPGAAMVFIACGSVVEGEDDIGQARRVLQHLGWTLGPEVEGYDEGIATAMGDK